MVYAESKANIYGEYSATSYTNTSVRSSLIYYTSDRHERHECNTSDANATQVQHQQHECDTKATRVLHEQHECETSEKF